jgi:hypothetical protein
MNVAVQLEFKAERKEPLGVLIRRVVAAFERAGIQPETFATFADSPGGIQKTSAVERAIKKYPHLARLVRDDAPIPNVPSIRRLTNGDPTNAFPMADLLALADGVPRSLPFHAINVHLGHSNFGRIEGLSAGLAPRTGIFIGDSWWVNGRNRALSALYSVEGQATSKRLPDPPDAIRAILAELGKPRQAGQFVAPDAAAAGPAARADSGEPTPLPEIDVIRPIVTKYRAGMMALVERIGLPHDLPSPIDAGPMNRVGSGPLKPTLVEVFGPRGYDCRGGSGTFTLRRRTSSNHIVDLELDVGTWSRSLTAMLHVRGPRFKATLMLPVTLRSGGQYPIGDTANWERIVANIAVIVDELERTFVPEIEGAAGRAPEWFEPGR